MDKMRQMYKCEVKKLADKVEKSMVRFIKLQTIMPVEVYVELDKRKFKMDLIQGGNGNVLVVIHRK